MSNLIIYHVVRLLFFITTRERARKQSHQILSAYMDLAARISSESGSVPIRVPPMRGVDEDMRNWSFYQILAHNTLVNRSITATVEQLSRGEPLHGTAAIDPKMGVMPSSKVGQEQIALFQASVANHLATVSNLGNLRRTNRSHHPIFGEFNAHRWNCMFPFHLKLHYPQAKSVVRKLGNQEKNH